MFTLGSEETFENGEIIFEEGNSGDWIYVILSGSVEISRKINGRKFILKVLKEGEIFGELSFIGQIKRTATAVAISKTTVGIMDRDSMDREFNNISSDFRSILVLMVNRFKDMIDRTSEYSERIEPRIPKILTVSFKDRLSFLKAYSGNISSTGLFIKTDKPLNKGEQFLLKLQLPELQEILKVNCSVVWSRNKNDEENKLPLGMGIKFIEMTKKDRQIFQDYIKALI